jgi:hypothetical protein
VQQRHSAALVARQVILQAGDGSVGVTEAAIFESATGPVDTTTSHVSVNTLPWNVHIAAHALARCRKLSEGADAEKGIRFQ